MGADPLGRDPVPDNDDLVRAALSRRLRRRGAAREMAALLGVTEAYLSQLRRRGTVPPRVAYLLGFRRVCRWEQIDK